jgi:hypothetical protein
MVRKGSIVHPMLSRAFYDSLQVFETKLPAIGLTILGAAITALIVFFVRGREGLKKHVVENILIVFGGTVATWLLVFVWVFVRLPAKMLAESNANLTNVVEEKRKQSITINSLTDRIQDLELNVSILKQVQPRVITRTLPAPEVQKRCWLSNHFGFPNSTIKGAVTATAVIIHCNNKIDAPFRIEIEFDRDFILGALVLPDSGSWMPGGGGKQGKIYFAQVNNPALLSDQLAVITVYGDTDQYPRALRTSVAALM